MSKPKFLIKPRYNALNNGLYFETDSLNALATARYNDHFGFYQRTFGVYNYMRLTKDLKFVIHYAQGTPFLWQAHNSCAWTPTGTLEMGQKEVNPCKAKLNVQNCYDEHLNSAYKSWIQWGGRPNATLDQTGIAATNEFTKTVLKNATMGARMTLTAGQLFDTNAVEFKTVTKSSIRDAFAKTAGTCRGWIELGRVNAANDSNLAHLDGGYIEAGDISSDGKKYTGAVTGDAVALYDKMVDSAPGPLQDAIVKGGIDTGEDMFYPLWLVSASIYRAVDIAYKAQKASAMMNMPRIERRVYQDNGRNRFVYFIDDTVVVPIDSVSHMENYLTGTSHFAYLTTSRVIQLGGSFANLPVVNETEVAIMTQMSDRVEDLGTTKFLAHNLFASAINDTDFVCGDYLYATAA